MNRAAVLAAAAILACRPQTASQSVDSTHPASDTLRGVLVLEGSEPFPIAALRTSAGRVVIDAPAIKLANLVQLDVWLRGARTATGFRAEDYQVRSANGAAAWDGVLRSGPDGLQLELADGSRHQVRGAPSSFARLTGSRVWMTEKADGGVREYGVLQQQ